MDLYIYMKIENGAIVEIRPQPKDNIEVETFTDYILWSRTSQMIGSNRHRFPRDRLFTMSSISTIRSEGTISVELRLDGKAKRVESLQVPLRITNAGESI
jgi:hypothetical protein